MVPEGLEGYSLFPLMVPMRQASRLQRSVNVDTAARHSVLVIVKQVKAWFSRKGRRAGLRPSSGSAAKAAETAAGRWYGNIIRIL